ncbi:MAG TPA: glutamine-hydrolyzing GMP synthase [Paludibacteraceae bacterium]|jgi:GMP synthase (glutamine-hydrolysing)|nr:glutamine-hydrolyzing GMP synthase [Paludibacteraceae bacterium]HOL28836.1 glutamine-hydrolyzing GMP synthase [Paludibacteraceae bacterium]HON02164.1 glutamine-hydrolyzing GMP synthase [Paludibacteraceae bacterium]HOR38555.1 glutamine-hydrolyzing GMP synthase [Paludibacteraceae bacterium]HPD58881.1 glutamine-hydrolyzing GMP synthase [Paludibacteraceae bacterium]
MEKIIILDFGSQTTQLIGRRLRELNEFCEILPYNKFPEQTKDIKGIILSGSPFSVYDPKALQIDLNKIRGKFPILGICYGAQYIVHSAGGKVQPGNTREYGRASLTYVDATDPLMSNIPVGSQIWMSHSDSITEVPHNFIQIGSTQDVQIAAFRIEGEKTWGVQFHPEVFHTTEGLLLLENFLNICDCRRNWTPASFIETTIQQLKEQLKDEKVVLGLSGGVDSSVTAVLLNRAIGKNLTCIFVDHGLLRKDEFREVLTNYEHLGLNVIGVDAKERFYAVLRGIADPEKKRKIIGAEFINVFNEEAKKIENVKWLAQGTIYPDVIESYSISGNTIKSHHNVGGLPEKMHLKLCEPLRLLFKDEVRSVGIELGMTPQLIKRHPFPGPGLAVRILGEVTPQKVAILQEADYIFIQELRKWDLYDKVWQAGCVLLPIQAVGVMGDERTYENVVALRAVTSTDAMTADWAKLPYDFLAKVSNEIINKVKGINRVVYDISSKPPATIEWE